MAYTIAVAHPSDIAGIIDVTTTAFEKDPIIGRLKPEVPADLERAFLHESWLDHFATARLTGCTIYKAVSQQGELVGFIQWQYPLTLSSEAQAEKKHLDATKEERLPLPERSNAPLFKDFFGLLDVKKSLYVDATKDYFLQILGVAPPHQGKGVGSALIRRGLADADATNARAYVEASPYGLPVYQKLGWKEIDRVVMDMSKYGSHGLAAEVIMMRDPSGSINAGIGGNTEQI